MNKLKKYSSPNYKFLMNKSMVRDLSYKLFGKPNVSLKRLCIVCRKYLQGLGTYEGVLN